MSLCYYRFFDITIQSLKEGTKRFYNIDSEKKNRKNSANTRPREEIRSNGGRITKSAVDKSVIHWLIYPQLHGTHVKGKTIELSQIVILSVIGILISPFLWFPFLGTKAFPGQHFINALTGVLLGPLIGISVPLIIGVVRISLGIGTIFAFPGGVPGVITVGLAYQLTKRSGNMAIKALCALAEPIGTVLIGGTLSLFLVAPFIGRADLVELVESRGALAALLLFWAGWAASSVPGAVAGYVALVGLARVAPDLFR